MFEYTSALKVMSKYLFKRFFYILDNLDLFSLPHFLFFFFKKPHSLSSTFEKSEKFNSRVTDIEHLKA